MIAPRQALVALVLAACAPAHSPPAPILENGARIASTDSVLRELYRENEREFLRILARRDSLVAVALRTCDASTCAGIRHGRLMLQMSPAEVMAATGTVEEAWTVRENGEIGVMVPRAREMLPRDAADDVDLVQLYGGRVVGFSYREAAGTRVVTSPEDTTAHARATWLADRLIREGDDFVAVGQFDRALNRYDRADILSPSHPPILDFKIARILDLQHVRPIEARMRYVRFLHQMELERIRAGGEADARMAAAVAEARGRLVVIERDRS